MTTPWAGASVPGVLVERLRGIDDARDQLAAIAMYHFGDLVRQVAWQVGDARAEDLVQDVILRHLARHDLAPRPTYASVNAYHKLRSSLIASTRNAAISHLRRAVTRVELPIGMFGERTLRALESHVRDDLLATDTRTDPLADLDGAALHDALRRVEVHDAKLLRMKLHGATFSDIAISLGVSLSSAFKAYRAALGAVQPILERYGAGDYCREYAPHLLLARQEQGRDADRGDEQPLTEMVGAERSREIQLHVFGDPDTPGDDGCSGCRRGEALQGAALVTYLPAPLLLLPAVGLAVSAKSVVSSVWGSLTGWFGLLGGGSTATGGAAAGAGVAAKGAAVVAAAVVAVGGTLTVARVADRPAPARPASTVTHPAPPARPAPQRAITPRRTTTTARTTPRTPSGNQRSRTGSAANEFTPAPAPSARTPRAPRTPSKAAAEFSP